MISVYDCAKAILLSIEKDFPNEIFNLGSDKLIMVKDLIKELINYSNSKSKIIFCKSNIINPFLYMFDFIGFPLLYPEQFLIADKNNITNLSMGMSSDYQDAIDKGSTHIRIGTSIFGKRNV